MTTTVIAWYEDQKDKDFQELKRLVDATGIQQIVRALASVCQERSAQLHQTWNRKAEAQTWSRDAKRLEGLASKFEH